MKKSITFTLEPYQIGHRGQGKCVVYNGSKVVVYNGSKVHEPRITGPDSFLGV